jgi:hypothetical protein
MFSNTRKMFGCFVKRRAGSMNIGAGLRPVWILIGLAIGLAVIGVVSTLSLLPAGTSAGLVSATTEIASFLGLIGLGIAVGLLTMAFSSGGRR